MPKPNVRRHNNRYLSKRLDKIERQSLRIAVISIISAMCFLGFSLMYTAQSDIFPSTIHYQFIMGFGFVMFGALLIIIVDKYFLKI